MLTAVEVYPPAPPAGWAFREVARVHGAFALVGVAALIRIDSAGKVDLARLGFCGIGGTPYVPAWLDDVMIGEAPSESLFTSVGDQISDSIDPIADIHANRAYRQRVAGVLSVRALGAAFARTTAGSTR